MSAIDAGPAWSAWSRVTPVVGTPAPSARYVRVLLPARVAAGASREPALARLPVAPHEADDKGSHDQTWTFAPRTPMRPTAVTFADGGALYERNVTVEASDDGTQWGGIAEAAISHYAEGGSQTTVPLEERTARFLRVTVHNGNDAPLRSLHPALLARPHAVVFARRATPYRLLSGNPNADVPSYDLGARLEHERWRAANLRAGETVANAGFRDPRPIGERFPWLITGALIAVAVVLGGLALRVVKPARET